MVLHFSVVFFLAAGFLDAQSLYTLNTRFTHKNCGLNNNNSVPTWLAEYSSTVNVLRIVCMSDYVRYGIQFLALVSFVEMKLSGVRIG
jgi:hypothetical protein